MKAMSIESIPTIPQLILTPLIWWSRNLVFGSFPSTVACIRIKKQRLLVIRLLSLGGAGGDPPYTTALGQAITT